ncbi:hypothetical protein BRC91_00430 [Halobacteriales archaeon QS_4_62_28]|nr:MAG: hypothetical protein BRC91_00430 [Halobacteriales archaeon QS_4_62_28]
MVSSPIIVDGVLFVGTDNDHTLHAMETGLEGSSEGSRVLQGMKNHHHEWAGTAEQTLQILNTGYHVADNIDDIRLEPDDGEDGGTGPYNGWFENVPNYEGTVDLRGQEVVTVDVGAGEIGHEFAPPAVLIDPGVRVVWKWTGRGGSHNVVIDALNFESELVSEEGYTVGYTFEDADVYRYYCEPHRGAGMKGVVAVGDTDDEVINPDNA